MQNLNSVIALILFSHLIFGQGKFYNLSEDLKVSFNKRINLSINKVDACSKYEFIASMDSILLDQLLNHFDFSNFNRAEFPSNNKITENIKMNYFIGVIASLTNKDKEMYLIKAEKRDTIDMVFDTYKKHIGLYLFITSQSYLKSIIHVSTCHKDIWGKAHIDFKISNDKIFLKHINDFSDDIGSSGPKDGVDEKEVYSILPSGHIELLSKWKYKRKY